MFCILECMGVVIGPRMVRDDRGRMIPGRGVRDLLGEVRVEAGKRWFSWRMVGGASAIIVIVYINAARSLLGLVQSARWTELAILLGIILLALIGYIAHVLAGSARSRGDATVGTEPTTALSVERQAIAEVLVSAQRCGACGYALQLPSKEPDGCVICSECGSAWEQRRCTKGPVSAAKVAADVEAATLAQQQSRRREHDDRLCMVLVAGHVGRADGLPAGNVRANAIVLELKEAMWARRRRLRAWLLATGLVLLVVGMAVQSPANDWTERCVVLGLLLLLGGLCSLGLQRPWTVRRDYFLSYRVCARCLADLPDVVAKDGCVVCTDCGAAWSEVRLAKRVVTDAQLGRVTESCRHCGYDRKGIHPDQGCPECGLPRSSPTDELGRARAGTVPVCAACQSPLPGPERVCASCKYQAGTRWVWPVSVTSRTANGGTEP